MRASLWKGSFGDLQTWCAKTQKLLSASPTFSYFWFSKNQLLSRYTTLCQKKQERFIALNESNVRTK